MTRSRNHAHYVGFDQAHRPPRNPPDSARLDMALAAGAAAFLVALAAICERLGRAG